MSAACWSVVPCKSVYTATWTGKHTHTRTHEHKYHHTQHTHTNTHTHTHTRINKHTNTRTHEHTNTRIHEQTKNKQAKQANKHLDNTQRRPKTKCTDDLISARCGAPSSADRLNAIGRTAGECRRNIPCVHTMMRTESQTNRHDTAREEQHQGAATRSTNYADRQTHLQRIRHYIVTKAV